MWISRSFSAFFKCAKGGQHEPLEDRMMIRALVVDDERLGREGILQLSEEVPDLQVVDECATGREAIEAIRALSPDLIFLDIQMPELGGFELLDSIEPELLPEVVFVTAYDEYAVRAFEVNAVDYLVKPVNADDFRRAMARVRSRLAAPVGMENGDGPAAGGGGSKGAGASPPPGGYLRRLLVRDRDRAFFVPAEDILWLGAAGNYVRVATLEGKHYLIRGTLAEFEEQLDPQRYLRVHRSTIVNLDHLEEVRRDEMHRYSVFTADGRSHRVSRTARKALMDHH